jgi:hypothetical protein
MYSALGIHWASSIPAFLALLCVPAPFLFYKYGEKIRLKCKYAAESAEFMQMLREEESDRDEEERNAKETRDANAGILNRTEDEVEKDNGGNGSRAMLSADAEGSEIKEKEKESL